MAHLPNLPSYVEGALLIVVLTRLSGDEKTKLHERLSQCPREQGTSLVYAYCKDNKAQEAIEESQEDGCTGDIFKLAQAAKPLGWNRFFVVDPLSKCQMNGTMYLRFQVSEELELVIVSPSHPLDQLPAFGHDSGQMGVVCLRVAAEKAFSIDSLLLPSESEKSPDESPFRRHNWSQGIPLFNPDNPFFSFDGMHNHRPNMIRQALSTPLPTELVDHVSDIVTDMENEVDTDAPKTITARADLVLVHCFSPLEPEELFQFENELSDSVREDFGLGKARFVLFPWKKKFSGSRRDYWNLVRAGYEVDCIFYKELWTQHKLLLRVDRRQRDQPWAMERVNVDRAQYLHQAQRSRTRLQFDAGRQSPALSVETELMNSPHRRFYRDLAPYKPYTGAYMDGCPTVFVNTVDFTSEELELLRKELEDTLDDIAAFDELPKKFAWIYAKEELSTSELYNQLYRLRLWSLKEVSQFIVVDRQSFVDQTVMVFDSTLEWDENYFTRRHNGGPEENIDDRMEVKGMQWGRCKGRDAWLTWVNLEIANMNFDEFISEEETHYYVCEEYTGRFANTAQD